MRVHEGNVTDQRTVPDTVADLRERFGIESVVFVGDRGMITSPREQRSRSKASISSAR